MICHDCGAPAVREALDPATGAPLGIPICEFGARAVGYQNTRPITRSGLNASRRLSSVLDRRAGFVNPPPGPVRRFSSFDPEEEMGSTVVAAGSGALDPAASARLEVAR